MGLGDIVDVQGIDMLTIAATDSGWDLGHRDGGAVTYRASRDIGPVFINQFGNEIAQHTHLQVHAGHGGGMMSLSRLDDRMEDTLSKW